MRSRCATARGTARAAANETAPRIPLHPSTTSWRGGTPERRTITNIQAKRTTKISPTTATASPMSESGAPSMRPRTSGVWRPTRRNSADSKVNWTTRQKLALWSRVPGETTSEEYHPT